MLNLCMQFQYEGGRKILIKTEMMCSPFQSEDFYNMDRKGQRKAMVNLIMRPFLFPSEYCRCSDI